MKKKNFAAILKQQKKNLEIMDLDFPKVSRGYVLVKMKYSGICHTQLNEISGIKFRQWTNSCQPVFHHQCLSK